MNFEWFFSKKTIWDDCSKNKTLRTIVFITQTTIASGLIIIILAFSIGIGFKKSIKDKFLNIRGQIIIDDNNSFSTINERINFFKKNINYNYVKQIHNIIEKNVIIGTDYNKIGRFIYKGLYNDYNPIFFKNFLIKGSLKKKINSCHKENVILSKKIALLLGLDIGSNIKIDFLIFKKRGLPFVISKHFIVSGLYETGVTEFDDLYIIGNIESIKKIYKWKENFQEKLEIFLFSFLRKENIKKAILKKYPNNFLFETFYDEKNHSILEWLNMFDINIIIISSIVFVSLTINMVVFILILLLERIKTIGILKTLGAKNKVIYKIFIFYILQIFVPSLITGNLIGIILLIIQNEFHLISLNKMQYFIDFVPVYINIIHIIIINFSIFLICLGAISFPIFFINRISTIKVVELK
ncbi:ABC transporter permease [Blattabacterium cuenoti]|uniref:ABC transporter permease n=1 Tax=Blattabacterium cuenoti TaxID=1653831 RepID=UPI00163BC268|nr:FtsX-like permease family protein [Blattabacterium cuenoti]